EDDLILEATLSDGRAALRRVKTAAALESALEALFELPPLPSIPPRDTSGTHSEVGARLDTQDPALTSASASAPAPAPATIPPRDTSGPHSEVGARLDTQDPALASAPAPALRIGVDLGGLAAARIAGPGPYTSAGVSGFAQLDVGPWGLGVDARWDAFEWISGDGPDLEMATLALGLTIARRFRLRFGDVDAGVVPRLVAETQSDSVAAGENTLASTDIRGAAFVRAAFGHARPLRALVEVDAELSPNRVRHSYRLDPGLPALPAWSAGLAVGFAWAEP